MSQQFIGIGFAPNDRLGDPIRNAFDKANQNFTELYNRQLGWYQKMFITCQKMVMTLILERHLGKHLPQ